jgi:altronate dehydratase small subunit
MDKRVILLNESDNTVVACAPLPTGTALDLGGNFVTLTADIDIGHKLARMPIRCSEKIIKYGAVIGSANADIAVGEHVHTHNMDSDYLPTYTLDDNKSFVHH